MTPCPNCGLLLEPFQETCPRCSRQALGFDPPTASGPECPNCGWPMPVGGRTCLYCGQGEASPPERRGIYRIPPPRPLWRRPWAMAAMIGLSVLGGVLAGLAITAGP